MPDTDYATTANGSRLEHVSNGVSCPACDYLKYRHRIPHDEQRDLGLDDQRDLFNAGHVIGWDSGNRTDDMPDIERD